MIITELRALLMYFEKRCNETNDLNEIKELQFLTNMVKKEIRLKTMDPRKSADELGRL